MRGTWKVDGNIIKQTSNGESCIRLNPGEITSEGYIYKVRARKDDGNGGFLLIFNYAGLQELLLAKPWWMRQYATWY